MTIARVEGLLSVVGGSVARTANGVRTTSWAQVGGSPLDGKSIGWLWRMGFLEVIETDENEQPVVLSEKGERTLGIGLETQPFKPAQKQGV